MVGDDRRSGGWLSGLTASMSGSASPPASAPDLSIVARANLWGWAALLVHLALQWWMIRAHILRDVSPYYPQNDDQLQYLAFAYRTHEALRSRGLAAGISELFAQPLATGFLLPLEAAVAFCLTGPARLAVLSVNFAHFAALQLGFAALLRRWTRSWAVAFAGLGLLHAAASPYYWAGGLADFRFDLAALCLFGLFIGALPCVPASSRWSRRRVIVALVVLMVCTRYLLAAYVAGILAFVTTIRWVRDRSEGRATDWRRVALALIACAMASAAILWFRQAEIAAHYFPAHLGARIAARKVVLGLDSWTSYLLWYPRSLLFDHLGAVFLAVAALLLCGGLFIYSRAAAHSIERGRSDGMRGDDTFAVLVAGIVVVLLVLTVYPGRSNVVVGVAVGPAVLLVCWAFGRASRLEVVQSQPGFRRALTVLASVAFAVGAGHQAWRLTTRLPPARRASLEAVEELYSHILARAVQPGSKRPLVIFDHRTDFLNKNALWIRGYERTGRWPNMRVRFLRSAPSWGKRTPQSLEAAALQLQRAAFVVLAVRTSDPSRALDTMGRPTIPELAADYCRNRLIDLGGFETPSGYLRLYGRTHTPARPAAAPNIEPDVSSFVERADRVGMTRDGCRSWICSPSNSTAPPRPSPVQRSGPLVRSDPRRRRELGPRGAVS